MPIAAIAAPETTGDAGTPTPPAEPEKPASSDALFSKVFGARKPAAKVRALDLPLRINGRELGLVPARIAADAADSEIDISRLAGMLQEFTQEEPLARLKSIAGADGFGNPSKLEPGGVEVRLDQAELLVDVKVPPALRREQTLSVSTRGDAARGYLVLPTATVSAYTNIRAAMEYLAFPADGKPDGRQPLSVSFENAVNLKGWVVEAEAFYRENGIRRWSRGPARLVHDFVNQSVRLQAGDLNYPVAVGQSGRAMAGLAVSRNFSLQPYRSVQPSGRQDLILENPSTVEVLVNGQPTRTFRLDAGPYNLANFPGTTGTNDITVRITDVYGRQQLLNFPFFFDSQLLAPGVNEFSYALGYPSESARDRIRYDQDKLTFSGYHRVGVSDRLTLGASVQADRLQTVTGAELLYTTPAGTFSVEPAASFGASKGVAGTLRYRDFRTGEEFWQQRTVTLQATWRDSAFASFGTTDPRNSISWDVAARLGQPLLPELTATLSGRYQVSRDDSMMDGYSADVSLRRRINRVGSLDVTLSKSRRTDGTEEQGAYVTLRYSLDKGRQAVGASVDTIRRERRLDWRYQDLRVVDAWNLFADYTDRAGPDRSQGSVGYTHQRFLASVRHDWSERIVTGGLAPENRTTVNLASALAFADGKLAVTRPVSNSFAIVVPHPRLAGKEIGVDPVNNRYAARSDFLGPPVVPNISAYLVRPLLLDVPDLPLGYDIGTDRPAVQPGYRTGTLVPIGTDATVTLDGLMKAPDGEPAGLLSGILRPVGADEGDRREDLRFFTNRRGRFRVDSVRPGKWELLLEGVTVKPIPVEVPRDAEGVRSLGEIVLEVLP